MFLLTVTYHDADGLHSCWPGKVASILDATARVRPVVRDIRRHGGTDVRVHVTDDMTAACVAVFRWKDAA